MGSLCMCSGDTTASLLGLPMAQVSIGREGTAGVLVSEERTPSNTLLCETSVISAKLNFHLELIALYRGWGKKGVRTLD